MRTPSLRALLLVCAGAAGCTTSGSEDAGAELAAASEMPRSGTLALVRLERFPSTDAAPARVVTNAKVARYSGLDGSSVLKLLAVDVRDGESCTVSGRLDDFPLAAEARVALLSIGDISLRVGEQFRVTGGSFDTGVSSRFFRRLPKRGRLSFGSSSLAVSSERSEPSSVGVSPLVGPMIGSVPEPHGQRPDRAYATE